ncbi:MAG: Mth938-like domain-containing protein [Rhodovibrionaceae bacterium]
MDVTPLIPEGRQVIESYGEGRFRIAGTLHRGSVIVFPERTLAWPLSDIGELTPESLDTVAAARNSVDVVLLGCGAKMTLIPRLLREKLRAAGIVVEPMDTGAACRTFNVLLSEERRVAAALIAVD